MTEASLVLRWPGGDPVRPNWFYGWDYQGTGHYSTALGQRRAGVLAVIERDFNLLGTAPRVSNA